MMKLGKYEILEKLGQGGFGVVYLARDTTLDRQVAIKILHPQLTVDQRFIENFRREARLMAKVNHQNVVNVYEVGEQDGRLFISMQYLSGGSLAQKIKKLGPSSVAKALSVLRQVIDGLNAGQKQNLIHRDIKPANILFDGEGNALIGDYGVAHTVQLSTTGTMSQTGGGVGTPSYRAPELWNGTPPPSSATDQYSLACVFYEMISGDLLFGGDTTEQILVKHLIREPEFSGKVSPEIRAVLQKAVSKDPADRYASLSSFYVALERAAAIQAGNRRPASMNPHASQGRQTISNPAASAGAPVTRPQPNQSIAGKPEWSPAPTVSGQSQSPAQAAVAQGQKASPARQGVGDATPPHAAQPPLSTRGVGLAPVKPANSQVTSQMSQVPAPAGAELSFQQKLTGFLEKQSTLEMLRSLIIILQVALPLVLFSFVGPAGILIASIFVLFSLLVHGSVLTILLRKRSGSKDIVRFLLNILGFYLLNVTLWISIFILVFDSSFLSQTEEVFSGSLSWLVGLSSLFGFISLRLLSWNWLSKEFFGHEPLDEEARKVHSAILKLFSGFPTLTASDFKLLLMVPIIINSVLGIITTVITKELTLSIIFMVPGLLWLGYRMVKWVIPTRKTSQTG